MFYFRKCKQYFVQTNFKNTVYVNVMFLTAKGLQRMVQMDFLLYLVIKLKKSFCEKITANKQKYNVISQTRRCLCPLV